MDQKLTPFLFIALCLIPGCKQADQEVERTKVQIVRVARETGADSLVDAIEEGYKTNVAPTIQEGKQYFDQYQEFKALQSYGTEASVRLQRVGDRVYRASENFFSAFPDSEKEVLEMIDDYNRDFTQWLGEGLKPKASKVAQPHKSRKRH